MGRGLAYGDKPGREALGRTKFKIKEVTFDLDFTKQELLNFKKRKEEWQ